MKILLNKVKNVSKKKTMIVSVLIAIITGMGMLSISKNELIKSFIKSNFLNKSYVKLCSINENMEESTSEVIIYNNCNYEVVSFDAIVSSSKYRTILDKYAMDYKQCEIYAYSKIKELKDGSQLYITKIAEDQILVIKDYNDDWSYVFKM